MPAAALVGQQIAAGGDNRLAAGKGDRGQVRFGEARGQRFRFPALAVAEQGAALAHRVAAGRVGGVEGHPHQVAFEADRHTRIGDPEVVVGVPLPHRAAVADRVGVPGFGPGDAAQGRLVDRAARSGEVLAFPALAGDVAGDGTVGADRQSARAEPASRCPGGAGDRGQGRPQGNRPGAQRAGRRLGRDLDRALQPTVVEVGESPGGAEVPSPARGPREAAFAEAQVGAAVRFLAATRVERVGDDPRAEARSRPGEAAVAEQARELDAEPFAAGPGVAPGAGDAAAADVVEDRHVPLQAFDRAAEVDPDAVLSDGQRLRRAADRRQVFDRFGRRVGVGELGRADALLDPFGAAATNDPAQEHEGAAESFGGFGDRPGVAGPGRVDREDVELGLRAGRDFDRLAFPGRAVPVDHRALDRAALGSEEEPGVAAFVEGGIGDRARSVVGSEGLTGRFAFGRQQHAEGRRRQRPPGASGFVTEHDDLFTHRLVRVAADEHAAARGRDPHREPVRLRPPIGIAVAVNRGLEDLPAARLGVAEEGELFRVAGLGAEGQRSRTRVDAADRERQLPVGPGFARRGGSHQGGFGIGDPEQRQRGAFPRGSPTPPRRRDQDHRHREPQRKNRHGKPPLPFPPTRVRLNPRHGRVETDSFPMPHRFISLVLKARPVG